MMAGFPGRPVRARDADRAATCARLDTAFVDGQLDAVEHRERVAAAMTARTLAELAQLTADLQPDPDAAPPPAPVPMAKPHRIWRAYAVGLIVLCLLGIVGYSCAESGPRSAVGGPAAAANGSLFTEEGWQDFLTWLREEHGGTAVVDASVYPDYARVEVLEPDDPRHTRATLYPERNFGDLTGNRKLDDPLVDLAAVDHAALRALLDEAPRRLKVRDATSRYVVFGFPTVGPDVMIVYASNDYKQSGHLFADLSGRVLQEWPVQG